MDLFIVIISIAFLQVWGSSNPLHKDVWLTRWNGWLSEYFKPGSRSFFIIAIGMPVFGLIILVSVIYSYSSWIMLPLGTAIMLYSFGRGEFNGIVSEYTKACSIDDWEAGLKRASRLGVQVDNLNENDWDTLHSHVLDEAGYRGFERMFAVLFWFFVFGPIGAFAYRVIFLFKRHYRDENELAKRTLWVIEWPAVRLLGISFALTGNFIGCYRQWQNCLLCARRSTVEILSPMILGALSVDEDLKQTVDVTRKELELTERLYQRTLWLWLAVTAIFIIFA